MDLDYISTRRLSRFYDKLKDWLSLNYSTKVELAEATQDMRGATEQFAGAHGLVPTPAAADRNKFLKGEATWAELPVATASTDGFMSSSDKTKLDGIATGAQVNVIESITTGGTALPISSKTVNISVMTGATAQANGAIGLVPAPAAGDEKKLLTGDGNWTAFENDVFGTQLLDENDQPILDETTQKPIYDTSSTDQLWTGFAEKEFGAARAYADQDGHNIKATYATKEDLNAALGDIEPLLAAL